MQVFLQFSQLNHASSHTKGPIVRHSHPRSARGLPWPPARCRAT
jgi:hypothetical protein